MIATDYLFVDKIVLIKAAFKASLLAELAKFQLKSFGSNLVTSFRTSQDVCGYISAARPEPLRADFPQGGVQGDRGEALPLRPRAVRQVGWRGYLFGIPLCKGMEIVRPVVSVKVSHVRRVRPPVCRVPVRGRARVRPHLLAVRGPHHRLYLSSTTQAAAAATGCNSN